jgi:hypothetical protein
LGNQRKNFFFNRKRLFRSKVIVSCQQRWGLVVQLVRIPPRGSHRVPSAYWETFNERLFCPLMYLKLVVLFGQVGSNETGFSS